MTATIATVTGSVTFAFGGIPMSVAEFEVPFDAIAEQVAHGEYTLSIVGGSETLRQTVATALRSLADQIAPAPVVELAADLAPGFVELRCPDCDVTVVGRPGESIAHADAGAHVMDTTYGTGE